jgi:hypothetical protein
MKLSVMDRMTTSALLPAKASYANHMLIEEARAILSFTEDEHKLLNFRQEGEMTRWDESRVFNKETNEPVSKDILPEFLAKMVTAQPDNFEMRSTVDEVEINLGDVVTKILTEALEALDKAEDLTVHQLNLYKKFLAPE